MAFRNTVIDAVRVLVGNVWTEVKTNGIYRAREVARITSPEKATQVPFAVIDWNPVASMEWGFDNNVDDGVCSVYYVADDSVDSEGLITKLEALRDHLLANDPTTGQRIGPISVSDSYTLELNRYFFYANRPFTAGAVMFRLVAGETT